jgi:hypothetical protein
LCINYSINEFLQQNNTELQETKDTSTTFEGTSSNICKSKLATKEISPRKTSKQRQQNTVSKKKKYFIWTNRVAEKENWEKITNVQNQTFTLPPKRYIIHMVKKKKHK